MGWPQIVMIVWLVIMGVVSLLKHGETTEHSFWASLAVITMYMVIFYFSGFWNGKGC